MPLTSQAHQSLVERILVASTGLGAYLAIFRFGGLNPLDADWLFKDGLRVFGGDSTTHYLGWEFFRNGQLTAWPPGRSTTLGPGGGASILHTDSVPLVALPIRLLLRGLNFTAPFQFLGIWMLLSFIFQAYLAGKVLLRLGVSKVGVLIGASLFVCAPIFIYRMGYNIAVGSQWLILLAILLALRESRNLASWLITTAVATAVNPYLTAMVLLIFLSNAIIRLINIRRIQLQVVIDGVAIFSVALLTAYLLGLFIYDGESLSTNGFGDYTTNVVSIVDPAIDDAIAIAPSWSKFNLLPDLPNGEQHQWEGFAYLGTGLLLLVMITSLRLLPTLIRNKMWWISIVGSIAVTTAVGRLPLISTAVFALTVGLLVVFVSIKLDLSRESRLVLVVAASLAMAVAVSHRVYVGAALIQLPVPEGLLSPFGFVRVSGRMVWITVYVVMFVVIVLADHAFRRAPKLLAIAVVVVVALQVADGGEGYQSTRDYMSGPRTAPALTSELWGNIGSRYRHIVFVLPRQSPHLDNPRPEQDQTQYSDDFWFAERALWADLGELAVRNKMSLNAFYFARSPANEYEVEAAKLRSIVANNGYRKDTLYVFIDAPLWNQAKAIHRRTDAIGLLNGVPILAPGLTNCTSCSLADLVPVRPVTN